MSRNQWIEQFEPYAQEFVDTYQAPGVSVGLAQRGELFYTRGFGYRDREEQTPVTPDTVFGIGSITKSFTSMALMQLVDEGRITVDDPVVKYLPEFHTPDEDATRQMTLHHFMTHTSGLPPLGTLYAAMARSMEGDEEAEEIQEQLESGELTPVDTYEELMEAIGEASVELLGPPGTRFSYSNDAYALLGAIVERVSDEPYTEYVRQHILEPAGMDHSTFDLEVMESYPDVTTIYASRDEDGEEVVYRSPRWREAPSMAAAGFLRSSVRDMIRYLEIFRTGGFAGDRRILSREGVAQLVHQHVHCSPNMYYGYGLMSTPRYHGLLLIEHGGGIKGVAAQVTLVPECGLTGVALANLAGVASSQILLGAVNAYTGLPVDTRRVTYPDYSCPPEQLEDYRGVYASAEGAEVQVTPQEQGLSFEMEGKEYPGRPVGEDAFVVRMKLVDSYARFLRTEAGAVYAVELGLRIVHKVADNSEEEQVEA